MIGIRSWSQNCKTVLDSLLATCQVLVGESVTITVVSLTVALLPIWGAIVRIVEKYT